MHGKARKCGMCPFVSKYSGNLLKHKRIVHANVRAFRCERCSYVAKTSSLLKRHIRSKHKEDPLALLKEKNVSDLEVNGGSKESKPVAAEIKESMLRHIKVGQRDSKFVKCELCPGRNEILENNLLIHIETAHLKSPEHQNNTISQEPDPKEVMDEVPIKEVEGDNCNQNFKCGECTYEANYIDLMTHIKTVHLYSPSLRCDKCPFTASSKVDLNHHVHIHEMIHKVEEANALAPSHPLNGDRERYFASTGRSSITANQDHAQPLNPIHSDDIRNMSESKSQSTASQRKASNISNLEQTMLAHQNDNIGHGHDDPDDNESEDQNSKPIEEIDDGDHSSFGMPSSSPLSLTQNPNKEREKEFHDTLLKAAHLELKAKTTFWELKNKRASFEAQKAEKECEKAAAENFIALLKKNTAIADYNRATGEVIPLMPLPKEINK